jgi:predicted lipoprotein with Yx(FWY)xxD motif
MLLAMRAVAGTAILLSIACCSNMRISDSGSNASFGWAPEPLPLAVGVLDTDEGPVFTDKSGMTLYVSKVDKPGQSECKIRWVEDSNSHSLFKINSRYPAPPCTQQWHPLIAGADAKAVGDWSIITRPEGTKQWAYHGFPVHTSYLDFLPGDVNGSVNTFGSQGEWRPLSPKPQLPPGIQLAMQSGVGLIATMQGKALYSFPPNASTKSTRSAEWQPLRASELTAALGAWSVTALSDGSKQWAYRGQPLYMYDGDVGQGEIKGFGVDQARPVILYPTPAPPGDSGISIKRVLFGDVYVSSKGMTLYDFTCRMRAPGTTALGGTFLCSSWSDDPGFREQYCPAPDKCSEMWRPLQAPANARPRGGTWSVAIIPDPAQYPLRWVPDNGTTALSPRAIKVWTHKGRPVYTSSADQQPGDFNAHNINSISGERWLAVLAGTEER